MHKLLCILAFCCASLASEISSVKHKDPSNECGLKNGGAIVQQIARPNKVYQGFFWMENPAVLFSVSPTSVDANAYKYDSGEMYQTHIKELEGSQLVKQIPFMDDPLKYLLVTDKALYIFKVQFVDNSTTYTLHLYNTLFTNNDHSIISALTDMAGNVWLGVSNAKEANGSLLKFSVVDNKTLTMQSKYPSYTDFAGNHDHSFAYAVDSKANVARSFQYVEATGNLTNDKVVFDMKIQGKSLSGKVSCITVDTDGNLWIGLDGGGAVIQYNPNEQKILQIIGVPAAGVVSVMFGGDGFKVIFVGTRQDSSEAASGSIFAISGSGATDSPGNFVANP